MKTWLLACLLPFLALAAGAGDFFDTCRNGTPEQVQAAIKAGADVNAKDKDGKSVLDHAWDSRNTKVVDELLKAGAKRIALPTKHTVQNGEYPALIARRYYGKENMARGTKAIMEANPGIGTPHLGGKLILTIPELK